MTAVLEGAEEDMDMSPPEEDERNNGACSSLNSEENKSQEERPREHKRMADALKADGQKADDAEIPKFLWNREFERGWSGQGRSLPLGWKDSLDGFRVFGICYWHSSLHQDFNRWMYRRNNAWRSLGKREISSSHWARVQ